MVEEEKKHETHHEVHHDAKHHKVKVNVWMISTVVLAVIIIAYLIYNSVGANANLSADQASKKAIDFINGNLLPPGSNATVKSVVDLGSVYNVKLQIGPQEYDSYVTKDGSLLFPTGVEMKESAETSNETANNTAADTETKEETVIPKSDKPILELYVMAQCPYGTQAEAIVDPILKTLGEDVSFELNFIGNIVAQADYDKMGARQSMCTKKSDGKYYCSLHGEAEVNEDIRQLCISSLANDKIMDYIACVNADIRNVANIWKNCSSSVGIDTKIIEDCWESEEGLDLFAENIKLADENGVTGSPTIFVNGVRYGGSRSTTGIKDALCNSFNEAPSSCGETVTDVKTTASGGCGG